MFELSERRHLPTPQTLLASGTTVSNHKATKPQNSQPQVLNPPPNPATKTHAMNSNRPAYLDADLKPISLRVQGLGLRMVHFSVFQGVGDYPW